MPRASVSIKGKLSNSLKQAQQRQDEFVWKGPFGNDPNSGITQSMLKDFLVCRERFRLKNVLGLRPTEEFNHRIEYGNMWHLCEEALANGDDDLYNRLDAYTVDLTKRYPLSTADILKWHSICQAQFPIYVEWWSKHEHARKRKGLFQEEVFSVDLPLPSGRTVTLRGKFDSVYEVKGKVWIQENKTKGDIDKDVMKRNLNCDLQSMFYPVALEKYLNRPVSGILYNVVRRPLSGGRGSIRQKKNQTESEFYEELGSIIKGACGPEWGLPPDEHYFFMRWNIELSEGDLEKFCTQSLYPVLEQLCDWWDWISSNPDNPFDNSVHYRMPFGVYSPLYNGKPTEYDSYLETGSTVGLHRVENLFGELRSDNEQQ